ncbi:MAG: ribosomal protein S19 family protein [Nanobdellota archaeon]
MAKKIFTYKGKKIEELQKLSIEEFSKISSSDVRRKVKRGFSEEEKRFLEDLEKHNSNIKTHCRDMVIFPFMVGRTIGIHNGKTFVNVEIQPQMVGQRLGEMVLTRAKIKHGAVGVASAIKH